MYSYNILGNSCKSSTIALTSNHKFYPYDSNIYMKQENVMYRLPVEPLDIDNTQDTKIKDKIHDFPEIIKSFHKSIQEKEGKSYQLKCKGCSS